MRSRSYRYCAATVFAALLLVACGSDDADDATGSSPPKASTSPSASVTNPAASESTSPASESTSPASDPASSESTDTNAPASGEPIKIGNILDTGTEAEFVKKGLEAGIAAVNADGGVDGRPIEIVYCSTERDPNIAAKCARDLVDSDVVALVSSGSNNGPQIQPILEEASIPSIAHTPNTGADANSSVAFPANLGVLTGLLEPLLCAISLDAKTIAVPLLDAPAAAALPDIMSGLVAPHGAEISKTVAIPLTASDLSGPATIIEESNPDCIAPVFNADLLTSYSDTLVQLGYTETPMVIGNDKLDPAQLRSDYPDLNLVLVGAYDVTSEGWAEFQADMDAYDPGGSGRLSDAAATGWIGIQIFREAAENASSVDRADLLEYMSGATIDIGGMTPPLDFTAPSTFMGGGFPRITRSAFYPYRPTAEGFDFLSENNEPVEGFAAP